MTGGTHPACELSDREAWLALTFILIVNRDSWSQGMGKPMPGVLSDSGSVAQAGARGRKGGAEKSVERGGRAGAKGHKSPEDQGLQNGESSHLEQLCFAQALT